MHFQAALLTEARLFLACKRSFSPVEYPVEFFSIRRISLFEGIPCDLSFIRDIGVYWFVAILE